MILPVTTQLALLAAAQPDAGGLNLDAVETGPAVAAASAGDTMSTGLAIVVAAVVDFR